MRNSIVSVPDHCLFTTLKVSRLGPKLFRLWANLVQFQQGSLENDRIWYKME